MSSSQKSVFSIENVPYLYQYEYLNKAWGIVHNGYFVMPDGSKYKYNSPKQWSYMTKLVIDKGDDLDAEEGRAYVVTKDTLEPEELFTNLRSSVKQRGLFSLFRSKLELSDDILQELMTSEVEDFGFRGCDMGMKSNILWIYDATTMLYKRILLSADGDIKARNQSTHSSNVVWKFGTAR
jgi:hypothetical protein